MKNISKKRGFTLIEISIVLIVIALIIIGTLQGQKLIESSRILKTYDDVISYTQAFDDFRDIYAGSYPGDRPNLDGAQFNNIRTGRGPTNVRGNNIIETFILRSTAGVLTEELLAWHHLNVAGLIETPFQLDGRPDYRVGFNVPQSGNSGNGFVMFSNPLLPSEHGIRFGSSLGRSRTLTGGAISGEDSELFDKKFDDGRPNSGDIRALAGINTTAPTECFNANTDEYSVGSNNVEKSCALIFILPR